MNNDDIETVPKKKKLAFEYDPEQTENFVSCAIFKLNNDCFNEIFDYLSLKELYSIAQTCKRLLKLAGEYFHDKYLAATKYSGDNGIYTEYSDNNGVQNQRIQTSGFNRYITTIAHYYERMAPLQYIHLHADEFDSIRHIYLVCVPLNPARIKCIEKLLGRIESVQMKNCSIDGADFYEIFLKFCINLKHLFVQDDDFGRNRRQHQPQNYAWLFQNYPKLEHLELIPAHSANSSKEMNSFFHRNRTIHSFSTSLTCIWRMRDVFLNCDVKLNQFEVKTDRSARYNLDETMASVCILLNQLYKRGFYKRLHFYVENLSQITRNQLFSLNGLEKLCIKQYNGIWKLPELSNLLELALLDVSDDVNLEPIANNLTQLQRLFLSNASFEHLTTFIRLSKNLIRVKFANNSKHQCNEKITHLSTLNIERSKLLGARKVTIYAPDNIYLQIKWSTNTGNMKFDFIEMKRSDSFVWNQHY